MDTLNILNGIQQANKIPPYYPILFSHKKNGLFGEILMEYKGLSLDKLLDNKQFAEQINDKTLISFFFTLLNIFEILHH